MMELLNKSIFNIGNLRETNIEGNYFLKDYIKEYVTLLLYTILEF